MRNYFIRIGNATLGSFALCNIYLLWELTQFCLRPILYFTYHLNWNSVASVGGALILVTRILNYRLLVVEVLDIELMMLELKISRLHGNKQNI